MNSNTATRRTSPTYDGRSIPQSVLGELTTTSIEDDLQSVLDNDGYVYIRKALDPACVNVARQYFLQHLAAVDEIDFRAGTAIATGRSKRRRLHPDLGLFWQQLSEAQEIRQCVHAEALQQIFTRFFDEPAIAFDFIWLRAFVRGGHSPLHIDHPYMNRGTPRCVSCWIPLGAIEHDGGPLFVIEKSHRLKSLREAFEGHDVDLHVDKPGFVDNHPLEFARHHGLRILSSRFEPGDILIFDHFTAHASFDNQDPSGRIRLSCDTRWQPASEPMDERFKGPNPGAHGGLGYACLSSAKPLNEEPERR